jgi:hypothetical protein
LVDLMLHGIAGHAAVACAGAERHPHGGGDGFGLAPNLPLMRYAAPGLLRN